MLKNLYAPLSGGVLQERLIEIISNNLANTNTTAFKEDEISFTQQSANPWPNYKNPLPPAPFKMDMSALYPLHGDEMEYVALGSIQTSHVQGALQRTGKETDLALRGEGFFSVTTAFGERLTRDGSFAINHEGYLTTQNGALVQGENGPITGLLGGPLRILAGGEVYVGERFVDKIKLVAVQDKSSLERLGENLWLHNGPLSNTTALPGEVEQGYLEGSNVNPMRNLTNLIIAHRTYEALQKTVKSQDDTMQNANRIAEV